MIGKFLFIRGHLIAFASYGFLAAIALDGLHVLSSRLLVIIIAAGVLLAIAGSLDESHRAKSGIERGELEKYGCVLSFCGYPRPGTSLLKALDKYANILPEDIQEVKMQTCGFSNPYLQSLSVYFAKSGVPKDTPMEIMGVGEVGDLKEVAAQFPRLTVTQSRAKLNTHFNIVKAKNQYFVWYEPQHDDTAPNYIPSQGAFLVKADDEIKALARYEQDRDQNRFLSTSLVVA